MHSSLRRAVGVAVFCSLAAAGAAVSVDRVKELIRSGRYAEAVAACDAELQGAPRGFVFLTLKGLALGAGGDAQSALQAFRQAIAINGSYLPALMGASEIEYQTKLPEAVPRLRAVLRLDPASAAAHSMLGSLLFEKRECREAISHFEKAHSLLESPAVRWPYAVCLMQQEQWGEASRQFRELLRIEERPATRYNLGLAQWNAKDFRSAVETLKVLWQRDPSPDTARLLASALDGGGETSEAIRLLQEAQHAYPNEEGLIVDLAVSCADHKAVGLGIEIVEAALRNRGASTPLLTLLGALQARNGDFKRAQEAFGQASGQAVDSNLGAVGLASTMMQLGLAQDAVSLLRGRLRESGNDPRVLLTLARGLVQSSRARRELVEAADALREVLRSEPGNPAAHGLLGKVLVSLGDHQQAVPEFARAIELDPEDRTSTYQLMLLYRQFGKNGEAARLAARVKELADKESQAEAAESRFQIVRQNGSER